LHSAINALLMKISDMMVRHYFKTSVDRIVIVVCHMIRSITSEYVLTIEIVDYERIAKYTVHNIQPYVCVYNGVVDIIGEQNPDEFIVFIAFPDMRYIDAKSISLSHKKVKGLENSICIYCEDLSDQSKTLVAICESEKSGLFGAGKLAWPKINDYLTEYKVKSMAREIGIATDDDPTTWGGSRTWREFLSKRGAKE